MTNYYIGWTEQQLLTERRAVQERMSRGAQELSRGAEVESRKKFETQGFVTLQRIQYSLSQLPAADCNNGVNNHVNPYSQRAVRTRAQYRFF